MPEAFKWPRPTPKTEARPPLRSETIALGDEDIIEEGETELGEGDIIKENVFETLRGAPDNDNEDIIVDFEEEKEPGKFQEADVHEAFNVMGFERRGLEVAATIEKKPERQNKPENKNEDNILADAETGLIGVLDGLGGMGHGDLASKMGEEVIPEAYKAALESNKSKAQVDIIRGLIDSQMERAGSASDDIKNAKRIELTKKMEDLTGKDTGMARKALSLVEAFAKASEQIKQTKGVTTACTGFVHQGRDGKRWAVVANVGDSGAFIKRAGGQVEKITQEDSMTNLLLNTGALDTKTLDQMKSEPDKKFSIPITLEMVMAMNGTKEDYETKFKGKSYPIRYKDLKKMMPAALGGGMNTPSLDYAELQPGDELIFATDGVLDMFEDPATEDLNSEEMSRAVSGKSLTERMNSLRQASKKREASYKKDDDIAIVGVKVK